MDAAIKVNRTVSKTVTNAVSAAAFDTDYATAVQALGEAQLVATHFAFYNGTYVAVIIYIPG